MTEGSLALSGGNYWPIEKLVKCFRKNGTWGRKTEDVCSFMTGSNCLLPCSMSNGPVRVAVVRAAKPETNYATVGVFTSRWFLLLTCKLKAMGQDIWTDGSGTGRTPWVGQNWVIRKPSDWMMKRITCDIYISEWWMRNYARTVMSTIFRRNSEVRVTRTLTNSLYMGSYKTCSAAVARHLGDLCGRHKEMNINMTVSRDGK